MNLKLVFRCVILGLMLLIGFNSSQITTTLAQTAAQSDQKKTTNEPAEKPVAPNSASPDGEITSNAVDESAQIEQQVSDIIRPINRIEDAIKKDLLKSKKIIESPTATIDQLVQERDQLVKIRQRAADAIDKLQTPINDFKARLQELGPAPKEGQSETPSIAKKRKALTSIVDQLSAANKQLNLLELETDQLSSITSSKQKKAFVERVFVARESVLNPNLWTQFYSTLDDISTRTNSIFSAWSRPAQVQNKVSGTTSLIGSLVIFISGIFAVFFIWKKMSNPPKVIGQANDLRRIWRAVGGNILVALTVVLTVFLLMFLLEISTVDDIRVAKFISAGGEAFFAVAILITVLRSVLAPSNSEWRLVNVSNIDAQKLFSYGASSAVLFGFNLILNSIASITYMPIEFIIGLNAAASIGLVVLFALMITTARNAEPLISNLELHSDRQFYFLWAGRFFLIFWFLVFSSSIALLLGYIALAHFVLSNTLVTIAMVAVFYLIHHLVDEIVNSSMQPWSRIGKTLRHKMGLGDETIRRLALSLSTVADITVVLIGAPVVLSLWTITWIDFTAVASNIFFGFKVGDVFIQPVNILIAIGIFVFGLILVRVSTLWLNRRILERSTIDVGVQNSISTAAKYTGLVLASGFALTAAGVDFSKLAIVAGALSVGIGFGLQSVVSNFVSGLILLAERPINIGDWVEVSGGEGTVKKINVRSTEIVTFDRCSVIIPNSKLISDPVKNWSLGSPVGRIKVLIGVSYDADPDQVRDILVQCAIDHDQVIDNPAPKAMFMDFGASSLDFQLRVFLKDIDNCTTVASDLRFAMFRELKKAGIEIPFPQRDLNIRNIDELAQAVNTTPRRRARK